MLTDGKEVVLAVNDSDERDAVGQLLQGLHMIVHHAYSGQDAIYLLEDHNCDFLVMDVQLSDMHAWKMINQLKEVIDITTLPTIVIMDEKTSFPLSNVTSVVRPVSMAKLKHIIFSLFSTQ